MSALITEIRDNVAILTSNRPERRNAMSLGLMRLLDRALDEMAADEDVRAVILTGAGDKAFGAGLDIKEAALLSEEDRSEQHALYEGTQRKLAAYPKPLIAAIEGVAAGGSLQLALHCDLVVVAEGARIGMPELSAGRPCIMGSFLLTRSLGPSVAARLVLGQDWIGTADAAACGLATRVVPQGEALECALGYGAKLAATAPKALTATLGWMRELRNGGAASLAGTVAYADRVLPELAASDEAMAASASFAGTGNA
ncbi:enoyl-CoA hydratase/isomerase family protein [Salipiger sp. P9]|uniref:enoyl-CoA hydratase/isomerase family protein n=1 Tax=Salipiger pentaromativorans TaxID=2943193 RepID=UPI002157C9F3|nr:enoyl-CoA hydratase/isomerase family protein [Salipiger pentaromativorans]MCR8549178.1 enoyl-CoA hydratase/isomerase family protein [Salipiger pentaromativorans]